MTGFLTSFSDNCGEDVHQHVVDEEVDDDDMQSSIKCCHAATEW